MIKFFKHDGIMVSYFRGLLGEKDPDRWAGKYRIEETEHNDGRVEYHVQYFERTGSIMQWVTKYNSCTNSLKEAKKSAGKYFDNEVKSTTIIGGGDAK